MATVPIVTEVTKAELDALVAADGLNEGLQYKVTDKLWILIATSPTTLVSNGDKIAIQNGDTLPSYISSDILYITASGTEDYSLTPLNIPVPPKYNFSHMEVKCLVPEIIGLQLKSSDGTQLSNACDLNNVTTQILLPNFLADAPYYGGVESIDLFCGSNSAPGFTAVLRFFKSYF